MRVGPGMRRSFPTVAAACAATLLLAGGAHADVRACRMALVKASAALTKQTLKRMTKCLLKEDAGRIPGPCPDAVTAAKLAKVTAKVEGKITRACASEDLPQLGFGGLCNFDLDEGSAAEDACRLLPTTTPAELATCLTCWQRADLFELEALFFASHAVDVCGGTLGTGSEVCSEGGCAASLGPTPDQRDLSGTELDCQRGIAKAGFKDLAKRQKLLAKCALGGRTRQTCLADPGIQLKLAKAAAKTTAKIVGACGNLQPVPNAPFCCRTGGNSCMAAGDRDACVAGGGQVQEGKICGADAKCDNVPGNKAFPWWDECPLRSCGGTSVTSIEDLAACVQGKAEETVDGTLCSRFPGSGWPCPSSPSGAFLDER
jgi:hypothetical protein